jgi:hypothetical protein
MVSGGERERLIHTIGIVLSLTPPKSVLKESSTLGAIFKGVFRRQCLTLIWTVTESAGWQLLKLAVDGDHSNLFRSNCFYVWTWREAFC